jgi:metal-responsive CopG/Arc/MetJ family transcriptional regulator
MDIHLTLPEALLREIDRAAKARGLKRAAALRLAAEELLRRWERERTDEEMRACVRETAAASGEWVRLTARDNRRRLLEETAW